MRLKFSSKGTRYQKFLELLHPASVRLLRTFPEGCSDTWQHANARPFATLQLTVRSLIPDCVYDPAALMRRDYHLSSVDVEGQRGAGRTADLPKS